MNADTATSSAAAFMTVSDTWTEVKASTDEAFQGLVALPCAGAVGGGWANDANSSISLGVGAAGAETLLARGVMLNWTSNEVVATTSTYSWPSFYDIHSSMAIPKGSRIVTKITTGRAHTGAIVFGVPYS